MKNKSNKKLLSLITLCSGMLATVALGVGGVVYSLRQGDGNKPIDQNNPLPNEVYRIENNVLMSFTDEFLADTAKYGQYDTMEIPASVTSINESAFCPNNTTIPDFINKLTFAENSSCLKINRYAFTGAISLKSVSLPEKITMLGDYTFDDCSSLTSVDLSNCTNLSAIGDSAFNGCSSLKSIDLSKCTNLSSIGPYAFENCLSLASVAFSSSLESIGYAAFWYSALSWVDLSNCTNLSSIDKYVFGNCHELTSITFPSSLTSINSSAFLDTSNLSSITWNAWQGGTTLGSNSFSGVCPTGGTVTVTDPIDDQHDSDQLLSYLLSNGGLPQTWVINNPLPEEVYTIENDVLKGFTDAFLANPSAYSQYNTMEIPASVTSIGGHAFIHNISIRSTIPSFITKLTFDKGSKCMKINTCAFLSCSSITSVDLSKCNNLSSIGEDAFRNCSTLTSVLFPNSLTEIIQNAFLNCSSLNYIAWDLPNQYSTNINIGGSVFSGFPSSGWEAIA